MKEGLELILPPNHLYQKDERRELSANQSLRLIKVGSQAVEGWLTLNGIVIGV